jgi:hypothetical protein
MSLLWRWTADVLGSKNTDSPAQRVIFQSPRDDMSILNFSTQHAPFNFQSLNLAHNAMLFQSLNSTGFYGLSTWRIPNSTDLQFIGPATEFPDFIEYLREKSQSRNIKINLNHWMSNHCGGAWNSNWSFENKTMVIDGRRTGCLNHLWGK